MSCVQESAAGLSIAENSDRPETDEQAVESKPSPAECGHKGTRFAVVDEYSQILEFRLSAWRGRYALQTDEDEWIFRQYVASSIRIDRCLRDEPVVRAFAALRADLCWNEDRRLEAEELGARLARRPSLVGRRLTKTRQGCEWLLDRWRELSAVLDDGREWNELERSLAFDLLGTRASLRHRDPWPEGGSARELARRQVETLERLKADSLEALDEREREAARRGVPVELPRPLAKLFRYEAACVRRLSWAREQLRPSRPEPPKQPEPAPQPPSPEPQASPSDLADRNDTREAGDATTASRPPVPPSPTPAPRASEPVAKAAVTVPAPAPEPPSTVFVPIRMADAVRPPMNHKMRRAARRRAAKAAKGRS
jgi:hypothetical protein